MCVLRKLEVAFWWEGEEKHSIGYLYARIKNPHLNRESTLLFLRSFYDCCGNKSQNQYRHRKIFLCLKNQSWILFFFLYTSKHKKLIFPSFSTCMITKMWKKEKFTSIHVHVGTIEKGENNSICKLTVLLSTHCFFFYSRMIMLLPHEVVSFIFYV